jgi:endogenous inhibitor of DNA gyrase (YacG/DUF329 family)
VTAPVVRLPGKCPICSRPTVARYRPFCSRRCRAVDLNRWLTGSYAIPAVEEDEPDEESTAPPPEKPNPE